MLQLFDNISQKRGQPGRTIHWYGESDRLYFEKLPHKYVVVIVPPDDSAGAVAAFKENSMFSRFFEFHNSLEDFSLKE